MLSSEERQQLAIAMLGDVLDAVSGIGTITILSKPGFNKLDLSLNADVLESYLELNDALNALIENWQAKGWPADLLIVMADLALLTRKTWQDFSTAWMMWFSVRGAAGAPI